MTETDLQWYCPLPFKSVFVDSTGVSPCCQIPRQSVTLDQWANHPWLKNLQQQFLSGNQPKVCNGCWMSEQRHGSSMRTESIRDYNHEISDHTSIDFIDYRSSNICNYRCRSCHPDFSHAISNEAKHNPVMLEWYGDRPETKTVRVQDINRDWILNNVGQIRRFMFTGGEPTLIPEVRTMLEHVLASGRSDVQVLITTNGSFTDDFWRELTLRLPNLHWTVSIDAVGPDAEIIRHGTNWPLVHSNLAWLAQYSQSLNINTVVSNLNVMRLAPVLELGRWAQGLSREPLGRHGDLGCRHQFFVCDRPYYLSAYNWPDHLRGKVLQYLVGCRDMDLDEEQRSMLDSLIRGIETTSFDKKLWKRGENFNDTLDQIRGENHWALRE